MTEVQTPKIDDLNKQEAGKLDINSLIEQSIANGSLNSVEGKAISARFEKELSTLKEQLKPETISQLKALAQQQGWTGLVALIEKNHSTPAVDSTVVGSTEPIQSAKELISGGDASMAEQVGVSQKEKELHTAIDFEEVRKRAMVQEKIALDAAQSIINEATSNQVEQVKIGAFNEQAKSEDIQTLTDAGLTPKEVEVALVDGMTSKQGEKYMSNTFQNFIQTGNDYKMTQEYAKLVPEKTMGEKIKNFFGIGGASKEQIDAAMLAQQGERDGAAREMQVAQAKMETGKTAYTIATGDTLSSIALTHGTTVSDITHLNAIADANSIQPGQVLQIPNTPVQFMVAENTIPIPTPRPDNMTTASITPQG